MSNDSWNEHRLLVLANFERQDKEIAAMKKEIRSLSDRLKDQNWKIIIVGIVSGVSASGGIDLLKILFAGVF